MKAWFVTSPTALDAKIPGGVQLCSQEFLSIVSAAFPGTEVVKINHSRSLPDRLHKRFGTAPYRLFSTGEFKAKAEKEIEINGKPGVVFLNMCETTRLAETVKNIDPSIRVVLLSHGTQTGDDLYEASGFGGVRSRGWQSWLARWKLGTDLCFESDFRRRFLDMVGVMSQEEQVLERWLGAGKTFLIPRLVSPDPIVRKPVKGRIGYVGTLDHTPNVIGLEKTLSALDKRKTSALEVRLVGGPAVHGERLEKKFSSVRYLGSLDNKALQEEASSWDLFINPIFWLSKGASMKLSQVLKWKIPFISTRSGARGYLIPGLDSWIVKDEPGALVAGILRQIESGTEGTFKFNTAWSASQPNWPTKEGLAQSLKASL